MQRHPTLGVREMRIKGKAARLFIAVALAVTVAGTAVAVTESPAAAAATSCKTLYLSGDPLGFAINPRMTVPICYNGGSVWQSGNITPGVTTVGFYVGGFDWYGSYGGGNSFGVGENFFATTWGNTYTTYCAPRWAINVWSSYSYWRTQL